MALKKEKVIACIIARNKSERLPGKSLIKIGEKNTLEILFDRIKLANEIDSVVLCTSNLKRDVVLVNIARKNNVDWVRAGDDDVLSRLLIAANNYQAKYIVRITADDILTDVNIMDRMIQESIKLKIDYNYCPDVIRGMDAEIIYTKALRAVKKHCKDPNGTEYLSFYLKEIKGIKIHASSILDNCSYAWHKVRLTLDYPQDLKVIQKVVNHFGTKYFGVFDVFRLYEKNPEMFKDNQDLAKKDFNYNHFVNKYIGN